MAQGFVYQWTDHKTNKLYIGSHKGDPDDGYICSSKYMLKEYVERPEDFSREIIQYFDSYSEARQAEIDLLRKVDAANNPAYYNKSNGGVEAFRAKDRISEEHKKKVSLYQKGRKKTEEHKNKIRMAVIHKHPKRKEVYTPYGKFYSLREAARELNMIRTTITRYCNDPHKTDWKYA